MATLSSSESSNLSGDDIAWYIETAPQALHGDPYAVAAMLERGTRVVALTCGVCVWSRASMIVLFPVATRM